MLSGTDLPPAAATAGFLLIRGDWDGRLSPGLKLAIVPLRVQSDVVPLLCVLFVLALMLHGTALLMAAALARPARIAVLAVAGCLAALAIPADASAAALLIRAQRVYLSPDAPPIDDGVVLIEDGRILAAGSHGTLPTDDATELTQCAGGVVAAGFQNSHVHFTESKWKDAGGQPAEPLAAQLRDMLTRYGFTTVVDTGSLVDNTVALRDRIARGELPGPRILTAGTPLYPANGIPLYLRDLPPDFLAQLPQPESAEAALAHARANLDRGADATKLFVMTPQGGGKVAFMARNVARIAADETHRRGRLVLAHPTDIEGMRIAIESGVDVLVHTTIGRSRTAWDAALIADLLAEDIAVIPTLMLWPYELKKAGLPQRTVELATGDAVQQLRDFSEAGGQLLFGTDVGYMSDYDPTEEYRLMARAFSPMQILATLTTAPAARWRETDRRGRVAPGQDADLVVLEADPAADVANFAKVRCTIRAGSLIHGPQPGTG
jgi:imidazolonepropionase-like amidohydrolase